jgi:uncharacterized protein with PIN domain
VPSGRKREVEKSIDPVGHRAGRRESMTVSFSFYGELNDFPIHGEKGPVFRYECSQAASVKHAIESFGVPHPEVDLILVNGRSVDFDYTIRDRDTVQVYPARFGVGGAEVMHLCKSGTGRPKFILDVHLGTLAGRLRLLGMDTLYRNDYGDREIVRLAAAEDRVILTRDIGILMFREVRKGYWVRSKGGVRQLEEIVRRFKLDGCLKPFSRCLLCNGKILAVPFESVRRRLDRMTAECYREFYRCESCGKIYWKGTHYENMRALLVRRQVDGSDYRPPRCNDAPTGKE